MKAIISGFIRGLYFIRFSLALWLFPFLMLAVDCSALATITRAILTPEMGRQALTVGFMLFSSGMVVVLTIRLVALNGPERFPCELDEDNWLVARCGQPEIPFWFFVAAHTPGAVLLGYVAFNVIYEEVRWPWLVIALLPVGAVLAFLFWLLIGLFYWWTFDPKIFGTRPPRWMLFPRRLVFFLSDQSMEELRCAEPPPVSRWMNWLIFKRLAAVGGEGFSENGNLYEGHRLAIVGLAGLLLLYLYCFVYTAPTRLPFYNAFCNAVILLLLLILLAGVVSGERQTNKAPRRVKLAASVILLAMLVFVALTWAYDQQAPRGFAVLASVLLLVTGWLWLLAGVAFLTDASRLPVLTVVIPVLFLLKLVPIYRAEHYFSVHQYDLKTPNIALGQPAAVLESRIGPPQSASSSKVPPLIVVSAEGGGIHSAAWTARVMMLLAQTFENPDKNKPFASNVLLLSGVSGGSVGLLPFLQEYAANGSIPGLQQAAERVNQAANCSSLQAVAWGLTYYDALNFLSPIPLTHSSGVDWTTDKLPKTLGLDRSWALETALARNLTDESCTTEAFELFSRVQADPGSGYRLTLAGTAKSLMDGHLPAFTFNTTAVETGDRFLLANYELPLAESDTDDVLPAESFLQAYDQQNSLHPIVPQGLRLKLADLPLATAARLSATFPFISSASRIPAKVAKSGEHFVDGGYFDNDGTSSVVEFLHYALSQRTDGTKDWCYPKKLPILFIEIRNDSNPDTENRDAFEKQEDLTWDDEGNGGKGRWVKGKEKPPGPWGPFKQVVTPLVGFWNAGHQSDTRRNRREVCMMEKALSDRLRVHHMIFDYRDQETTREVQPLSWELTPRQQTDIECAIDYKTEACKANNHAYKKDESIAELAGDAAAWFHDDAQQQHDDSCKVFDRGWRRATIPATATTPATCASPKIKAATPPPNGCK